MKKNLLLCALSLMAAQVFGDAPQERILSEPQVKPKPVIPPLNSNKAQEVQHGQDDSITPQRERDARFMRMRDAFVQNNQRGDAARSAEGNVRGQVGSQMRTSASTQADSSVNLDNDQSATTVVPS